MSSYLPPSDNLNVFNPNIFNSGDDTGITLSEANSRYVKKSGSNMTGALSTPSLVVNSIDVGTELGKISNLETDTTGITYDNTNSADKTTIDNNVTISSGKTLLIGTTNIGTEINKIDGIQTATNGITYETAPVDKTTIANDVQITGTFILPNHTDVDTEFGNLETKMTGINYDNSTGDLTTIDNNVTISSSKNLLLGTINVATELNKIDNIETATSGITYNSASDKTTISSNNVEITGTFILPGITDVEDELDKIGNLETKTQDLTFSALNGTSLFANNVLGTQNHGNVDTKLTSLDSEVDDLQTATTGITYDDTGNIDKTTIDNNVKITASLDLTNHIDVGTKLTNIISDITGITYDDTGGIDLTTINNNVLIETNKYIISPQIQLQSNQYVVTTQTSQLAFFSKNTSGRGIGFYMGSDTGSNSGETMQIKINGDIECKKGNLIVSGSGKTLSLPDHNNVDLALTNLETDTTGIEYYDVGGISSYTNNTTEISSDLVVTSGNNLLIGSTNVGSLLNTPSNFITAGTNLEWNGNTLNASGGSTTNTTGINYTSGTDTKSIDNNLAVSKKVEAQGGVYTRTMIFNDMGSNYDSNITGGTFGNHAYFRDFGTSGRKYIVSNFGSMSSGIFTFSATGTYKIEVNLTATSHPSNFGNNLRQSLGCYISFNDETASTNPFKLSNRGRVGCIYLRDNNDGIGGSCYLQDYLHVSSESDTIRIKTLVDSSDGDASFDDTCNNNSINISIVLIITLICETTNILQTP